MAFCHGPVVGNAGSMGARRIAAQNTKLRTLRIHSARGKWPSGRRRSSPLPGSVRILSRAGHPRYPGGTAHPRGRLCSRKWPDGLRRRLEFARSGRDLVRTHGPGRQDQPAVGHPAGKRIPPRSAAAAQTSLAGLQSQAKAAQDADAAAKTDEEQAQAALADLQNQTKMAQDAAAAARTQQEQAQKALADLQNQTKTAQDAAAAAKAQREQAQKALADAQNRVDTAQDAGEAAKTQLTELQRQVDDAKHNLAGVQACNQPSQPGGESAPAK